MSHPSRLLTALSLSLIAGTAGAQNLITDPNFTNVHSTAPTYWYLEKSPFAATGAPNPEVDCLTPTQSGLGCSIILINPAINNDDKDQGDRVFTGWIPVTAGKTYTLSFYIKTDSIPQSMPRAFALFPNLQGAERFSAISSQSVTLANHDQWQKTALFFTPPAGESYAQIVIEMARQPAHGEPASKFWISNVQLTEGMNLPRADPDTKAAFNGGSVKVDKLGNFQIKANGNWVNFFPLCIYADANRVDADPNKPKFSIYAEQGFNCNMWAGYPEVVKWGAEVGMMSGYEIAGYLSPEFDKYENLSGVLQADIAAIKGSVYADNLLLYYWDNENALLEEWAVPNAIANTIDSADRIGGVRQHPIYTLQGNPALARKYSNGSVSGTAPGSMSDIVGTYFGEAFNTKARGWGYYLLENLPGQKQPASIAQLNAGVGYEGHRFIAAAYTALAKGAKGIGFWRDCFTCGATPGQYQVKSVEYYDWWDDLPRLAATIQSQIDLLRTPHWTSWTLSTTSPVEYGTRNLDGRAYFIASNESENTIDAAFTLGGLNYTPLFAQNAYTKEVEATVRSNHFTLPIAANQGGIYKLGTDPLDTLVLDLKFNGNLTDTSVFGHQGSSSDNSQAYANSSNTLSLNGATVSVAQATQPSTTALDLNKTDFTLIARARISNGDNDIIALISKGLDAPGYAFMYGADTLGLYLASNASDLTLTFSDAVVDANDGHWHTLAVSVDRSSQATFYYDGVAVGGGDVSGFQNTSIAAPDKTLQLGAWAGGPEHLLGALDNVRIYKAALSATTLAGLSSNALTLGLQNADGDRRYDRSLFGNDIASASFVWNSSTANGNFVGFKPNQSGNSNNKILVRNNDGLELDANTDFSISARVQFNNASDHVGIVSKGAGTPSIAGYVLTYNADTHQLGFWPGTGVDRGYYNSNAITINNGQEHDVVVTFSRANQQVNFYVDGASAGSVSVPAAFSGADFTNTQQTLTIGSWGTHVLNGTISNVFIDRRVISSSEIQERHALPSPQ